MKIKNFKKYATMLGLTFSLTLTGCENQLVKITTDINSEISIDEYLLNEAFLNFTSLTETPTISNIKDKNAFKSISLVDLIELYNYNFVYNQDTYTINKEQQIKLLEQIKSILTANYNIIEKYKYNYNIPIENLILLEYYKIEGDFFKTERIYKNRKLGIKNINVINNYDTYIIDEDDYIPITQTSNITSSIPNLFREVIIKRPTLNVDAKITMEKCINILDYILLQDQKIYSEELNKILLYSKSIPKEDEYQCMNHYLTINKIQPIDFNDTKLRFNPNKPQDIENSINNYINKCINNNNFTEFTKEILTKDAVKKYYLINLQLLSDNTINYLEKTYFPSQDINLNEIRFDFNTSYVDLFQEELASSNLDYQLLSATTQLISTLKKDKNTNQYQQIEIDFNSYQNYCYSTIIKNNLQYFYTSIDGEGPIDKYYYVMHKFISILFLNIYEYQITKINYSFSEKEYHNMSEVIHYNYYEIDKLLEFNNSLKSQQNKEKPLSKTLTK